MKKLTPHLSHIVAFHAQQCVEKVFKAVLEEHKIEVPRIHSLVKHFMVRLRIMSAQRRKHHQPTNEPTNQLTNKTFFQYKATLHQAKEGGPRENQQTNQQTSQPCKPTN